MMFDGALPGTIGRPKKKLHQLIFFGSRVREKHCFPKHNWFWPAMSMVHDGENLEVPQTAILMHNDMLKVFLIIKNHTGSHKIDSKCSEC